MPEREQGLQESIGHGRGSRRTESGSAARGAKRGGAAGTEGGCGRGAKGGRGGSSKGRRCRDSRHRNGQTVRCDCRDAWQGTEQVAVMRTAGPQLLQCGQCLTHSAGDAAQAASHRADQRATPCWRQRERRRRLQIHQRRECWRRRQKRECCWRQRHQTRGLHQAGKTAVEGREGCQMRAKQHDMRALRQFNFQLPVQARGMEAGRAAAAALPLT